jgi:hypothetical protein
MPSIVGHLEFDHVGLQGEGAQRTANKHQRTHASPYIARAAIADDLPFISFPWTALLVLGQTRFNASCGDSQVAEGGRDLPDFWRTLFRLRTRPKITDHGSEEAIWGRSHQQLISTCRKRPQ